jgi:uncharacterized protein HemX
MITLLARLLGGSTIAAWLVVAALGAGALGGAYFYVRGQGYEQATLEWSVRYNERELALERQRLAELDRQAAANDAAKAAEAARIAQLRNELSALERELQEQSNEADIDPNADRVGLSAGGVQRIQRIGGAR